VLGGFFFAFSILLCYSLHIMACDIFERIISLIRPLSFPRKQESSYLRAYKAPRRVAASAERRPKAESAAYGRIGSIEKIKGNSSKILILLRN